MELIEIILFAAALLCSLVAGFLIAFEIVLMPGIAKLSDLAYLHAFKVIDGVIQNNQPVFILIWLGSALAAIAAAVASVWHLTGFNRLLVIAACVIYLLGVQLPTVVINVPLNNQLQAQDLEKFSDSELKKARKDFEGPWLRWNSIRTLISTLTSVLLIVACVSI
ncbi:MAG: DUF1772 domain-containing protein [Pyrinomonadaceae bacterium]|nr:DUF1772 domain-containing protein [Pyrinomonadaceae bacterium]